MGHHPSFFVNGQMKVIVRDRQMKNRTIIHNFRMEPKWQLFYSFLTPTIMMMIAFMVVGIAPFGNFNLMAMDGYAQYFPMLREYVRTKSDWSFAGALGFNQLTQSAYYTNSPLWLLLHLVPEKFTIEAIHFIVMIRFGLAGLSFAYFIIRFYQYRTKFVFVFSTAYALSAYTLAFINQFMWMDIVILLPLIAASLHRLWEEKNFLPYILVLTTALYSNFYLAYMLCLFAVLWSLYLMFRHPFSAQRRLRFIYRFALSSVLSAGLAAFVLLPTYFSLQNTLAASVGIPDKLIFYHPIWKYLLHVLPFQKISLAYEEANVYCGLLSFLLAAFYLLQKRRTVREKCMFVLFVIGSYLSFNLNLFDYLWHGFHYPSQLPARQSFLFIFVLLIYACKTYNERNFVLYRQKMGPPKRIGRHNLKTLIAVILLFEIMANTMFTLAAYTWKANHNQYIKYETELQYLTETYAPQENEFYRMEFLQPAHNQGLRYGYNGLGYYSSTMSEENYQFFKDIGMDIYAQNVSTNYVPDALHNNIFAVRYLIQKNDQPVDIDHLGLIKVEELVELTLYENPDYYSIGFSVNGVDFSDKRASQMREQLGHVISTDRQLNDLNFLEIEDYSPDRIQGTLSLDHNAQLLTSIGHEEGWRLLVDGVETKTFAAFDYMLAAQIAAGDHEITFVYETPGKMIGLNITFGSLIVLFAWLWLENYKRNETETKDFAYVKGKPIALRLRI